MHRLERDERGAFLVMWAFVLVVLLLMVAIVVDLGQLRDTKRESRLVADLGALAAGRKLAGVIAGNTISVDIRGACQDAFSYIKFNTPDLPASTMDSLTDGCPSLPVPCVNPVGLTPGTTPREAVARLASGDLPDPYRITIRYPVADADISDPLHPASRPTDGKPCERMQVTVQRTRDTFFGGIAGINNLTTRSSAVVRGFGTITPTQVPALLLLERVGCGVLERQGNAGQQRLIVYASDPDNPGTIQADSLGLAGNVNASSDCANDSGGSNPGPTKRVAWAKATNSNVPGVEIQDCVYTPPSVSCADPPPALPDTGGRTRSLGLLGLHAIDTGSTFTAYEMGTPCPGPPCGIQATLGGSKLASRKVVDNKYLDEVKTLKTSSDTTLGLAATLAGRLSLRLPCTDPGALPAPNCGYQLYPDDFAVSCGGGGPIAATKVLIKEDCDLSTIPGGSSLVFNPSTPGSYVVAGKVNVQNNATLAFRNAAEILVVGCSTSSPLTSDTGASNCGSATGAGNIGIASAGNLLINHNPGLSGDIPGICPDPLTSPYAPGVVVLRSGRFDVAGSFTACQVFLYMSGVKPGASGISQNDAGNPHSTCTALFPCPRDNPNYGGYVSVQGSIAWIAPNQNTTSPRDPTDPAQRFEDLALWNEVGLTGSSERTIIKGGSGVMDISGVFFLPNQTFELSGSTAASPRDAQFLARRLLFSGTSEFRMRPAPQNSVGTPESSFTLIR